MWVKVAGPTVADDGSGTDWCVDLAAATIGDLSTRRDDGAHTAACAAIETTELRWFENGTLPPSMSSWWTNDGALGVEEERCDLSRTHGCVDIGVKLRCAMGRDSRDDRRARRAGRQWHEPVIGRPADGRIVR
jgi:hypothetical protein